MSKQRVQTVTAGCALGDVVPIGPAGSDGWLAFSKVVDLSSAIAKGLRTPQQMAALFGLATSSASNPVWMG